jgi:hypothetical protein
MKEGNMTIFDVCLSFSSKVPARAAVDVNCEGADQVYLVTATTSGTDQLMVAVNQQQTDAPSPANRSRLRTHSHWVLPAGHLVRPARVTSSVRAERDRGIQTAISQQPEGEAH